MKTHHFPITLVAAILMLLMTSSAFGANVTLEISEALLNKLVDTYRMDVLSDRGSDPPRCPMGIPTLFEDCHMVGFFQCPPMDLGSDVPPGSSAEGISLLMCERVGGGHVLVPAGEPIGWKYWVSDWGFTIHDDGLVFQATVNTMVAEQQEPDTPLEPQWISQTITKQAKAHIFYAKEIKKLILNIERMEVTLQSRICDLPATMSPLDVRAEEYCDYCPVVIIDIAEKYSFSIPIQLLPLEVPLPNGNMREINVRVEDIIPRYKQGKLLLDVDINFD